MAGRGVDTTNSRGFRGERDHATPQAKRDHAASLLWRLIPVPTEDHARVPKPCLD
jgi:hypothetical protein